VTEVEDVTPLGETPRATPPAIAPGERQRRRRLRGRGPLLTLAVVVLAVLVGGIVTALLPRSDSTSPRAVVDAYYRALIRSDEGVAFGLLCTQQQQSGLAPYAAFVAADERTGTGITRWRSKPGVTVRGDEAAVSGDLVLANGSGTPIQVVAVRQAGRWRVCGSNLGGILPPVGSDSGGVTA